MRHVMRGDIDLVIVLGVEVFLEDPGLGRGWLP